MNTSCVTLFSRFTGVTLQLLHPVVNYKYFTSCPCVLRNVQLHPHFFCRFITRYSKPNDFWSNDIRSVSEGFKEGTHIVNFMVDGKCLICDHITYSLFSLYGRLRTAPIGSSAIVLPDKQMYQQCSATA